MDDPYTSILKIKIPNGTDAHYKNVVNRLFNSYKDTFSLDTFDYFKLNRVSSFVNLSNNKRYDGMRRTMDGDSKLVDKILSKENIITLNDSIYFEEHSDLCKIIITKSFLEFLKYDPYTTKTVLFSPNDYIFDLEILAVVENLPDKADLVFTNPLDNMFQSSLMGSNINEGSRFYDVPLDSTSQFQYLEIHSRLEKEIIKSTFSEYNPYISYRDVELDGNTSARLTKVTLKPIIGLKNLDSILYSINEIDQSWNYPAYDWECKATSNTNYNDYIALYTKDLNQVYKLYDHLRSEKIYLDLTNVEEKNNFGIVSRLSSFLILVLACMSLFLLYSQLNNIFNTY